jgi:glycosyltransferase involved in cell wall biosynthesis
MGEGYGLAKARNMGLIEATGEIVVFCDDRLMMHPRAVDEFVKALARLGSKKAWVWGSKGAFKTFVENFSATWRRTVIDGGMFCERIDRYGGMTQEVSGRFGAQGVRFEFCAGAIAEPAFGTHSKSRHRDDITASKVRLYKMGFQ